MIENEKKLIELNKKLAEIEDKIAEENAFKRFTRKIALDFDELCLIARINCEINLRRVLRKYYIDMEICEEDIKLITLYKKFFSLNVTPDLDEYDLLNLAVYGSGNYTDEELNIFETILSEYNLANKPKDLSL